ncbi:amino acid adenylation domain-containing protein [Pseudoalteromonas sp. MMG013]|uniref:non-ribosomal peptide synthetase/type I polyketide synthase n=1 Tax=Pseudoalteromonas sp. MMG013 TaxID=2822687 RepID=UPI001B396CBB|nr:non-ribosomal peptide synthetase/type I polyketide synthase [Pseudoalteromonas sp. MMG013]MBQ4862176.1 amino acid adenylation domain-containing protein [Pseudoalteromonas sp. MMG013]
MSIENKDLPENGIAVIATTCRFPDAATASKYWENIVTGLESIRGLSEEAKSSIPEAILKQNDYVQVGSFVDDVEFFDANFFQFTPREADVTDPQQRMFLKCCYEALEQGGYRGIDSTNSVGVFGSTAISSYLLNNLWKNDDVFSSIGEAAVAYGNDKDYLATSVSYKLNLTGPSISVNTACSSSLVAIVEACKSLLTYECDIALAGGVRIDTPQEQGYLFKEGGIFSKQGQCHAFGANADGTVFGNGAGVVLLKRLHEAMEDGDAIMAVIRGFATNNDGSDKVGFTAPSLNGQSRVISEALAMAEVEAETIGYIEAHGTGTKTGDPIEIAALNDAFSTQKKQFCALGSVKSNIGHLVSAAGVAGFIKVVKALENKQLPPTLHCEHTNPNIDFQNSPFFVNRNLSNWNVDTSPRRASVSSFGIGGSNAHIVLEEAPSRDSLPETNKPSLLVLSAKTPTALDNLKSSFSVFLDSTQHRLEDCCYTLQTGRERFEYRYAVSARTASAAASILANDSQLQKAYKHPKVAMLFSGQGSQYFGMAKALYDENETFRYWLDKISGGFAPFLEHELKNALFVTAEDDKGVDLLTQTWLSQPAIFAIEYSLAKLWQSLGIGMAYGLGHSIGEYVLACLANVMSLENAIKLVAARGRIMHKAPQGSMLSVKLSANELSDMLGENCVIAAYNAPKLCVVAGPQEDIALLQSKLVSEQIKSQLLKTSHAFHSPLMDDILEEFSKEFEHVDLAAPDKVYVSSVTGELIKNQEATSVDYWVRQLREPVQFERGMKTLNALDEHQIFLEVGPGNTLAQMTRQIIDGEPAICSSLPHPSQELNAFEYFTQTVGQVWCFGVEFNWSELNRELSPRKIHMPTYPFEKQYHWIAPPTNQTQNLQKTQLEEWFYLPSWHQVPEQVFASNHSQSNELKVIFGEKERLGELFSHFSKKPNDVIFIGDSKQFTVLEDGYAMSVDEKSHYKELFSSLKRTLNEYQACHIVVAWDLKAQSERVYSEAKVYRNLFGLIYLAQAIQDVAQSLPVKLTVLSNEIENQVKSQLAPENALMAPLLASIESEIEQLQSCAVSIASSETIFDDVKKVLHCLFKHYQTGQFKYENATWWKRDFHSIKLLPVADPIPNLSTDGTYVVIGGLGGMGLTTAKWLASRKDINLVLISRSGAPDRTLWQSIVSQSDTPPELRSKVDCLLQLERSVKSLTILRADVSDFDSLQQAFAEIIATYKQVNGVFHAAGMASMTRLIAKSEQDIRDVVASKVQGTVNLFKLLNPETTEFVFLYSSIASFVGRVGQADYAAANRFMESYAEQMRTYFENVVTINWDTWQQSGMAANTNIDPKFQAQKALELSSGITDKEGIEVLNRVFANKHLNQVLVSTREWHSRMLSAKSQHKKMQPATTRPLLNDNVAKEHVAPDGKHEKILADIWQSLLGITQISRFDDFFTLGGDSVLASQVVSQLKSEYGINVPIAKVFAHSKLNELAYELVGPASEACEPDFLCHRPSTLPLSYSQKRMWIQEQVTDTSLFNMPVRIEFSGSLDTDKLTEVLNIIVARHEILRTQIVIQKGEPEQQVLAQLQVNVPVIDLSHLPEPLAKQELSSIESQMATKRFVIDEEPLLRLQLVRLSSELCFGVFVFHHMIFDAWSAKNVQSELLEIYSQLIAGADRSSIQFKHEIVQYADFSLWQKEQVETKWLTSQLPYWLEQLADSPSTSTIPSDFKRQAKALFKGDFIRFELDEKLTLSLRSLAQQGDATLYMVLLAAFKLLLSRYSGQQDVIVGCPISNRHHSKALSNSVGLYVNTLPLRTQIDSTSSFLSLLSSVRHSASQAYAHQDIPFDMIVEKLGSNSVLPFFQTMLVLQNYPAPARHGESLQYQMHTLSNGSSKFDLTMFIEEENDVLTGQVEFNTSLFKESTIRALTNNFLNLLSSLLKAPEHPVSEALLIKEDSDDMKSCCLNGVNKVLPKDLTIVNLIGTKLAEKPDSPALYFGHTHITRRELDIRSNQFAHWLIENGIDKGDRVGIFQNRSINMIVSILGLAKAGAIYVPLEPDYPQERLVYTVSDAQLKLVVCDDINMLAGSGVQLISSEQLCVMINKQPQTAIDVSLSHHDLAYIIYTSGSTGRPKGVVNNHGALLNRLCWMQQQYDVFEGDRILFKTPIGFDVSVWELFLPLLTGAPMVITPQGLHKEPSKLAEIIAEHAVTLMHFVPSMLNVFLQLQPQGLKTVKRVFCSGEALSVSLVNQFKDLCPNSLLENLYGPTEAAIDVTMFDCNTLSENAEMVPIGTPIDNTQIYILDEQLKPVPVGVMGELYIAGVNLATGYWHKPDLTATLFLPDPFSSVGNRMYKTGDLARVNVSGQIEYLGRIDDQVKVNGVRIELGEIESLISEEPSVQSCVVVLVNDAHQGNTLVAYYTGESVSKSTLRSRVNKRLPAQARPSFFIQLAELPITDNGKLDRKTLKQIDYKSLLQHFEYKEEKIVLTAPRNELERWLLTQWQAFLGVEDICIHDEFLSVGGDSLAAMKVLSAINEEFAVSLTLKEFIEQATVANISKVLLHSMLLSAEEAE